MNLYTPEQVQRLRRRVQEDPAVQPIANTILSSAAPWLDRTPETIRNLMPDAWVPRTRHITPATFTRAYATGCPEHNAPPPDFRGYPQLEWIYDPFVDPWHITCPEGGETYPSNDFETYYRTRDRSLLTGPYADDGYGWRPEGSPYRYWFIGHCCDRMWRLVMNGLNALSQAYLLTTDAQYAHKALVILDRLAEVYPDMDHSQQSMYALDLSPGYSGKLFNLISETGTVTQLCRALDAVRDTLPEDPLFGPTTTQTLTKLENGILGASLEGIYSGLVRGNYGMHQEALLHAAIATGDRREIDRAVDWVLNNTGEATVLKEMRTAFDDYIFRDKSAHAEGIHFALDSLHFREGVGWESSPSYNRTWIGHLTVIASLLERVGVPIHNHPKFLRMYRWPFEMICLDRFTPSIGDAGSIGGGLILPNAEDLESAYRLTRDPFLAACLKKYQMKSSGLKPLLEESPEIADPDPGAAELKQLTFGSRLMAGYGLGLLRSGTGKNRAAVSLYYGRAATEHGHFDRLNLEFFALNRKLTPDLGYGDHASEGDPPAIWTKNTAAHNTVVVDERRQDTQAAGRLEGFVSTTGIQFIDVDAPETYHSVSEYRRTVVLIEYAPGLHYALDLFRITGGQQHDYGLHGFDGVFETEGIEFGPEQPGTLAGPEIPFGVIHDDDGLC